eukprot:m.194814 g.194814  ORF g.194814 m.194814 type:complete len:180 (+) comp15683_c0_seq4:58-597(+)
MQGHDSQDSQDSALGLTQNGSDKGGKDVLYPDLDVLYKFLKQCNWVQVLEEAKCDRQVAEFKFKSYKIGRLTDKQEEKLSQWWMGLPRLLRQFLHIRIMEMKLEKEQDIRAQQCNKHDMARLIHVIMTQTSADIGLKLKKSCPGDNWMPGSLMMSAAKMLGFGSQTGSMIRIIFTRTAV